MLVQRYTSLIDVVVRSCATASCSFQIDSAHDAHNYTNPPLHHDMPQFAACTHICIVQLVASSPSLLKLTVMSTNTSHVWRNDIGTEIYIGTCRSLLLSLSYHDNHSLSRRGLSTHVLQLCDAELIIVLASSPSSSLNASTLAASKRRHLGISINSCYTRRRWHTDVTSGNNQSPTCTDA